MTNERTNLFIVPFVALASVFSQAACGSDSDSNSETDAEVVVTGVWIREPVDGQTVSAAYGVIASNGDEDITLVGASAPIEGTIEVTFIFESGLELTVPAEVRALDGKMGDMDDGDE